MIDVLGWPYLAFESCVMSDGVMGHQFNHARNDIRSLSTVEARNWGTGNLASEVWDEGEEYVYT